MVALNSSLFKDPEDSCMPLFPEVEKTERLFTKNRKAKSREFFLSREKNLTLSLLLLLGCYTALLVPALWIKEESIWKNENSLGQDMMLLNRSAAVLSRECRRGWSTKRLHALPTRPPLLEVPVFLERGIRGIGLPPPLGLQGSEETATRALKTLPQTGLAPLLESRGCRRCVVVGSGGVLHGSRLGTHIDQYDIIIRMNNAPVFGFEKDAGSRTTLRLMYPEGAPQSSREYEHTALVALVVFKSLDLDWLASVVTRKPLNWWSKFWFWREVVESIPLKPENFRILNPEIMHQTSLALQEYAKQQKKTVPTLGTGAVVAALHLCDEVSLAGFGYDLQHPQMPLHYYESLHTDAMRVQVVHDISAETAFLKELVRVKAVTDLTGALY
ncbi:lactosylceramide alpha-2,3-sialyltransferase-like [Arapaima gigas]